MALLKNSPSRRTSVLTALRRYPSLWAGLALLALFGLLVFFAPVVATHEPAKQDLKARLKEPSSEHYFGTDELGRDVFSRVIYGTQISLPASLFVVLVSLSTGTVAGALAGYQGGILDNVIMRLADVTLAFPSIVLALAISAMLGPGLNNAILAACVVLWPEYARLIRAQVLVARTYEYVVAARALGKREWSILFSHILPNTWSPVLIKGALDVGSVILLVSALSFIGLGVTPPTPEWGSMIALGRARFYQWWLATFPGLAILGVIIACNLLSEGLQAWLDPRRR